MQLVTPVTERRPVYIYIQNTDKIMETSSIIIFIYNINIRNVIASFVGMSLL